VRSHQSRTEGQNPLPQPAGHVSLDAAQDLVGLLGCECTLVAHVELFIHQYPQVLLGRAALKPFIPQPVLIAGPNATKCSHLTPCSSLFLKAQMNDDLRDEPCHPFSTSLSVCALQIPGMLLVTENMPGMHPREGPPHNIASDAFQKAAEEACPLPVFKSTDQISVESWLDERGHSLVPLSNPGSDPEVSLGSGGHGTLLGR